MRIRERARCILNLEQFNDVNRPEKVCECRNITPPESQQHILRMLVKEPFDKFRLPSELKWLKLLIFASTVYQNKNVKIKHPFCYITIRHGFVNSENDDEWHTDGFSMNINHIPEQNYIWCSNAPTQVILKPIEFPKEFDPLVHNVHYFIQDNVDDIAPLSLNTNTLYCLDPYVIHQRPPATKGIWRTFVRISYTPIEIRDDNNTPNPLLPVRKFYRDGVKDFRDKLIRY